MSTEIQISKKIAVLEEGALITPNVNQIDFVGNGVNASTVGDNVTVNIPGSTGSTTYYMNQSVNQAPYKEFSSVATLGVEQVVPATVLAGATSIIAEYQTPSGVPGTSQIPTGLWQFFLHFNAGAAGQNWIIRPSVYSRDLGGIETLLLTLDPVIVTNMSTVTTMYISDAVFPATTVLTTDRIVVKIAMENTTGVSQTVNFRTEGTQHYSVGLTTLNQVIPVAGVTAVTGTAPVVSSGGTTPAISMPQATNTVNGYLSAADWAVFKAKQDAITLTTTGSSGAATLVGATLNIPNYAGGASGVFGISNSLGVYTYYSTLTLAMAAADGGDTIEMFADVNETSNVTITLKDQVNIQGNGHTYTLNNASATTTLIDNGIAVKCSISNITFKTVNITETTYILKITGASKINGNKSTNFISTVNRGVSINNASAEVSGVFSSGTRGADVDSGTLTDSTLEATFIGAYIGGTGKLIKCISRLLSSGGNSAIYNDGSIYECSAYSPITAIRGGYIYKCLGVSTGSYGIGSAYLVVDSTAYSSGGAAIYLVDKIINSSGYSTAGIGIVLPSSTMTSCVGYSSTSNGIATTTSTGGASFIWNSFAYSEGAAAISQTNNNTLYGTSQISNCTIICSWDNAGGHAINASGTTNIANCTMRVLNASAKAIYSAAALTLKYANNTYEGSTAPISTTITQGIINTSDNQGNILV